VRLVDCWAGRRRNGDQPALLYFFLDDFGAACERALAAAFFDAALVRPSRRTLLAALAAEGEVWRWLGMRSPS
jgi:hypothetical protein